MINTKPVNEIGRISPISLENKVENSLKIDNTVKKVEPQFDIQKDNSMLNQEEIQQAIDQANKFLFPGNSRFEIRMHERTKNVMVKLVDTETDEVIKEIPTEKILDLIGRIWDVVGILVDERG